MSDDNFNKSIGHRIQSRSSDKEGLGKEILWDGKSGIFWLAFVIGIMYVRNMLSGVILPVWYSVTSRHSYLLSQVVYLNDTNVGNIRFRINLELSSPVLIPLFNSRNQGVQVGLNLSAFVTSMTTTFGRQSSHFRRLIKKKQSNNFQYKKII